MFDSSDDFKGLVYTISQIAEAEGQTEISQLLNTSEISCAQTNYDNWNGGIYGYSIYIVVDVKQYIQLKENIIKIESDLFERFNFVTRHLQDQRVESLTIIPKAYRIGTVPPNPHRPFTATENKRKELLKKYLDSASEDELIEDVLLPLFRQLGFHRITPSGHKDKAMEYGKDIWMRYTLPTQNVLYFGLQVKRSKLDAAGTSKGTNANVAEVHQQALMMLGHEIFDPEVSRTVLVDHAFIVAGGEITKAARNWLGAKLDISKRSQIMFLDRNDIINLYVVTNLTIPQTAQQKKEEEDSLPF